MIYFINLSIVSFQTINYFPIVISLLLLTIKYQLSSVLLSLYIDNHVSTINNYFATIDDRCVIWNQYKVYLCKSLYTKYLFDYLQLKQICCVWSWRKPSFRGCWLISLLREVEKSSQTLSCIDIMLCLVYSVQPITQCYPLQPDVKFEIIKLIIDGSIQQFLFIHNNMK